MSTDSKGHIPTKFDKWLLVKYKKYPTKQDIPPVVKFVLIFYNTRTKKLIFPFLVQLRCVEYMIVLEYMVLLF